MFVRRDLKIEEFRLPSYEYPPRRLMESLGAKEHLKFRDNVKLILLWRRWVDTLLKVENLKKAPMEL